MNEAREIFRKSIKQLLRNHGSLQTYQLYDHIKSLHRDLCDDDFECTCGGTPRGEPEWKHTVRWAQQDLKNRGEIKLVNRMWEIRDDFAVA
jgi:hypothetical protein